MHKVNRGGLKQITILTFLEPYIGIITFLGQEKITFSKFSPNFSDRVYGRL